MSAVPNDEIPKGEDEGSAPLDRLETCYKCSAKRLKNKPCDMGTFEQHCTYTATVA